MEQEQRLIDADELKLNKVYCNERHEYVVPVATIDWATAVEAAPVVHGRWTGNHCTECGAPCLRFEKSSGKYIPLQPHCWNCAAKMDL